MVLVVPTVGQKYASCPLEVINKHSDRCPPTQSEQRQQTARHSQRDASIKRNLGESWDVEKVDVRLALDFETMSDTIIRDGKVGSQFRRFVGKESGSKNVRRPASSRVALGFGLVA